MQLLRKMSLEKVAWRRGGLKKTMPLERIGLKRVVLMRSDHLETVNCVFCLSHVVVLHVMDGDDALLGEVAKSFASENAELCFVGHAE